MKTYAIYPVYKSVKDNQPIYYADATKEEYEAIYSHMLHEIIYGHTVITINSSSVEPVRSGSYCVIPLDWLKRIVPYFYDRIVQGVVEAQI
jgi:hypothetical protein